MLHFFTEKVFWYLDFLKGSPLRKHYNELLLINTKSPSLKAIKQRDSRIASLISHASTSTPFYKEFNKNTKLAEFLVINKIVILENYKAFKSDLYLTKSSFEVSTSGSTGIPLKILQDKRKKQRNKMDVLFFLNKGNYKLGQRFYDIQVWLENDYTLLSKWVLRLRNMVQISIRKFDDEDITSLLNKLKKEKSSININIVSHGLERICRYLDKYGFKNIDKIEINSIITISESLSKYVKLSAEKYFGTKVLSRYSNEELGIIAQHLMDDDAHFHINWASYHVEFLKMDNDFPAEENEMARIVITDLFNYCMPIIRYDTGDVGWYSNNNSNTNFPTITRIEGRKTDIVYTTSGDMYSSYLVDYQFWDYFQYIKQYQFIQTGESNYIIKLNLESEGFPFETQLRLMFLEDLGLDATICFEYVNEIPVLASGKQKKVVNTYKTSE